MHYLQSLANRTSPVTSKTRCMVGENRFALRGSPLGLKSKKPRIYGSTLKCGTSFQMVEYPTYSSSLSAYVYYITFRHAEGPAIIPGSKPAGWSILLISLLLHPRDLVSRLHFSVAKPLLYLLGFGSVPGFFSDPLAFLAHSTSLHHHVPTPRIRLCSTPSCVITATSHGHSSYPH